MGTEKSAKNIAGRIRSFAEPVVRELGYELWDVVFEKVGSLYELTVYIDSDDGIGIEDCEKVSRALDPLLDRYDPISQAYTFYVSSAGLERTLSLPEHFEKFMGHQVEVKLFRAVDGAKQHTGVLCAYENGRVTIENSEEKTFEPADISSVRLVYTGEL
ncbi:MAG: ribosome maturation factor RimP [Clostridiaceae bacterium]|nr:ribosome maturation factor RimP [Clostridiaceae bacterium]